jgi:hypothetical protein
MLTENQQALKDALLQDFKIAWFEPGAAFLVFFASLLLDRRQVSQGRGVFLIIEVKKAEGE